MSPRPSLWPIYALAALTLCAAGAFALYISKKPRAAATVREPSRLERMSPMPDFALVSHENRKISRADFAGNVIVMDFFFSRCKGVCPAMKESLQAVQSALGSEPRLRLLSVSVDTVNDTPEVLSAFAMKLGAKPGFWTFSTGEKAAIVGFAREGLKLGSSEVPGDILHSDRFVLVDGDGFVRGYYRGTERESVDALIADVRTLLQEMR
jgi:protein SCO1/2